MLPRASDADAAAQAGTTAIKDVKLGTVKEESFPQTQQAPASAPPDAMPLGTAAPPHSPRAAPPPVSLGLPPSLVGAASAAEVPPPAKRPLLASGAAVEAPGPPLKRRCGQQPSAPNQGPPLCAVKKKDSEDDVARPSAAGANAGARTALAAPRPPQTVLSQVGPNPSMGDTPKLEADQRGRPPMAVASNGLTVHSQVGPKPDTDSKPKLEADERCAPPCTVASSGRPADQRGRPPMAVPSNGLTVHSQVGPKPDTDSKPKLEADERCAPPCTVASSGRPAHAISSLHLSLATQLSQPKAECEGPPSDSLMVKSLPKAERGEPPAESSGLKMEKEEVSEELGRRPAVHPTGVWLTILSAKRAESSGPAGAGNAGLVAATVQSVKVDGVEVPRATWSAGAIVVNRSAPPSAVAATGCNKSSRRRNFKLFQKAFGQQKGGPAAPKRVVVPVAPWKPAEVAPVLFSDGFGSQPMGESQSQLPPIQTGL